MCFSAGASFGAGALLTVIGVASIYKAQSTSQIIFASIPILFGLQQITEGFLWLALTNPAYASLRDASMYNFLVLAQVVWPVWVPFAILKLEPKKSRRGFQTLLVGFGVMVSLYLGYCLVTFPVSAEILGNHISYKEAFPPSLSRYCGFMYMVATIGPAFFSSVRRMWMLGVTVLISYLFTALFYTDYVVSVWCFFASIISVAIFAILQELKKSDGEIYKSTLRYVNRVASAHQH